jgi:AcrR family transcriptional regulator
MANGRQATGKGLSRDAVIRTALEIADAEGLGALSFRRVASVLEVTPMALYRYVESKEALLDGLGDRVLAEVALPELAGDWRDGLRSVARSTRSSLLAHPAAVPILLSRPLVTPAGMRLADALLGLYRQAGFSVEQAALVYPQVARYVLALVTFEVQAGSAPQRRQEAAGGARLLVTAASPDDYPNLAEAAPHLAGAYDRERAFELGLDLVVAGLERLLAAEGGR